jgi:hypothetical protein
LTTTINVVVINPVLFGSQIQPVFTASCGCHVPGGPSPFSLQAGSSYGNLVNVQSIGACAPLKRVLPRDTSSSVLYKKVSGTDCGTQMPRGGTPLPSTTIQLIQDWINQGARNN